MAKDLHEWLTEAVRSGRYTVSADNPDGLVAGVVTGWTIWLDILEPGGTWAWHRDAAPGQVPSLTVGHAESLRNSMLAEMVMEGRE